MEKRKIGVKYCGNCNPHVDTRELFSSLKEELKEVEFIHWEKEGYGVLLILSSCTVDCASRPDFAGPIVVVAGNTINHLPLAPNQMVAELKRELTRTNNKK